MQRVITQKFIFRSDLRANPDVMYLFGDNLRRIGLGGQAKEMRGEPNACGIATKRSPGMGNKDFFDDAAFEELAQQIITDIQPAFNHIVNGGLVIIPQDGLGTGLSELPLRAPAVHAFLERRLESLKKLGGA